MQTPRYSVKQTGYSILVVPCSTWTKKNPLDNAGTGMPLTQDCSAPLIGSITGHYINPGTHSTSLWLAFLTSIQVRESSGTCFFSAQWLNYTLPHLLEIYQKPPYSRHAAWSLLMYALEGVHRNYIWDISTFPPVCCCPGGLGSPLLPYYSVLLECFSCCNW